MCRHHNAPLTMYTNVHMCTVCFYLLYWFVVYDVYQGSSQCMGEAVVNVWECVGELSCTWHSRMHICRNMPFVCKFEVEVHHYSGYVISYKSAGTVSKPVWRSQTGVQSSVCCAKLAHTGGCFVASPTLTSYLCSGNSCFWMLVPHPYLHAVEICLFLFFSTLLSK